MLPDIFRVSFESIRLRFLRKAITSGGETPPLQSPREYVFCFECISLKNTPLFCCNQIPLIEDLFFLVELFRFLLSPVSPLFCKEFGQSHAFILQRIICHDTSMPDFRVCICIFRSSHPDYGRYGRKRIAEKSSPPPNLVMH